MSERSIGLAISTIVEHQYSRISEFGRRLGGCDPPLQKAAPELQQTASWFEVNIHVGGQTFYEVTTEIQWENEELLPD